MKDHEIAALITAVADIAKQFHNHQSLRERIAQVLRPSLSAGAFEPADMATASAQGFRDGAQDGVALLQEVREFALWQPSNAALCERIDAYLDTCRGRA